MQMVGNNMWDLETDAETLRICLEDVLEWLRTGIVAGVRHDKETIMQFIEDVLKSTGGGEV